jgi:DNA repair exonuclease SbcCD ATPase subunit
MIKFKSVSWKNFLSTGNEKTTVQLDRSPTTLIVGQNGAGKSTLLDALSFALFGKAHRSISKPQLVNSINNKHCVVEVEFATGAHEFKVVRTIKPNTFEIYQNGNMINQSSAARDYQKFLEQNILKLNHKSFHQIVVLGSSSFIPFMQLPGGHRRDVIEDLLDINIFSKMNTILKERSARIKEELKDVNYNLDLMKEKITLQRKYIRDITQMNDEQINSKKDTIASFQTEITEMQSLNNDYSTTIESLQDGLEDKLKSAHNKKQSLMQYQAQFQQQMKTVVKEAKFYETNDKCPTCTQDIDESIKSEKLEFSKTRAKELQEGMTKVGEQHTAVETTITDLNEIAEDVRANTSKITSNNRDISRLQEQIGTLNKEIAGLTSREGDLGQANSELESHSTARESLSEKKLSMLDERSYNEAAGEMLKDGGIKTKVVKEYLPVMNKLINNYLQVLDFFVAFDLDENFTETIRSRHRDTFNYASFSEGEKQRIDLALLFTWRQIARMKNSTSTNLLVLDETFDSSLDHDGVDNLMKILGTLEDDSNVFVISHKGDLLDGKFRSKIEFTKEHNFSKIK